MFNTKMFGFPITEAEVMQLDITSSFASDVLFRIGRMPDGQLAAYWRKEPGRKEYLIFITKLTGKYTDPDALYASEEYRSLLEKHFPVGRTVLSPAQQELVEKLLAAGIPYVPSHGGRDGHSFRGMLFHPEPEQFSSWCMMPPEWETFANAVNMLVNEIAELDAQHYAAWIC